MSSENKVKPGSTEFNRPKAVVLSVLIVAASAAATLAIAGNFSLPFFWLVFALQLAVAIANIYGLDPALLQERMKPQGKDEDRFGRLIVTLLYLVSLIIPALDVGHWHIADKISFPLQLAGTLMHMIGWAGMFWTMRTNIYFSSAIRLQPDRHQQVITTGPYSAVRHPGYSFASLGFLGQVLMLGSWLGLIPIVLMIIDFIYRSFLEERILADGLQGYRDYMTKVKARWVPGLF